MSAATASIQPSSTESDAEVFGLGLAQASVLVVDDEPGIRNFLVKILGPRVGRIEQAGNTEEASAMLDANHFDILILDNVMPGTTGLNWLNEQRKLGYVADTILITAFADMDTAIAAMRAGAVDFVLKPFRANQILNAVGRCVDKVNLRRENYLLKFELATGNAPQNWRLLGNSPVIQEIRATLKRAARLLTPVLFTGDTGTGKEIAARALHAMSDRADKPFVPVNCATLSPDAIENELLGMVQSSNSDFRERSDGLFLNAKGGTLYLDEITELPLAIQSALLRIIEVKRFRPVGAVREVPLDLRFIFSSNANLEDAVAAGTFREDLYHRINVLNIRMPVLRERLGDIQELAMMFMQRISRDIGIAPITIDEGVIRNLARYDWPGNVRELRNLIERSLILGKFPAEFASLAPGEPVENTDSLEAMEKRHILMVLDAAEGNRAEAARRLGIARKTIDRKCQIWGV